MQAPPRNVLQHWVVYVRNGLVALKDYMKDAAAFVANESAYTTLARGSSLQTYLLRVQAIHALLLAGLDVSEAEVSRHLVDPGFLKQFKAYKTIDPFDGHKAFDFVEVLPRLYHAICKMNWPFWKKVSVWARFLLKCALIGRASDVTEYCPKIETIELPPTTADTLFSEREGRMPKYLKVHLTTRKSTNSFKNIADKEKGKGFLVFRNHLNAMVDPVYWLLVWIEHLCSEGISNGPLFPRERKNGALEPGAYTEPLQWERLLEKLFVQVGRSAHCTRLMDRHEYDPFVQAGLVGYTSHCVRVSAAVWAGRCGAQLQDIMWTADWNTAETAGLYLQRGAELRTQMMQRHGGRDPIQDFWIYRPTNDNI